MRWRSYRVLAVVVAGLAAAAAGAWLGRQTNPIDGFLYDLSLAVASARPGTSARPVAVIALDRDSLAAEELAPLPRAFLSPIWARLVNALGDAGIRAAGFDIVFEYSANRLPGSDGQYDKEFLLALARARDRVVLGRSAQAGPALPFAAAARSAGADVELASDPDGVVRAVDNALVTTSGQTVPSFAAAILMQAKGPPMPARVLLAPRTALEATPTYRLIDVLRCAERDPAGLRQAFSGKVVLIGTNLPEEDRKRSVDRFMEPAERRTDAAGGCPPDRLGASDPGSGTVPGVFIHAAAVEAVLTGDIVRPIAVSFRAVMAALFAIAGGVLGFALRPWLAALGLILLGAAAFATALVALGFGWWVAPAIPFGAALLAAVLAYVMRFLLEERRRRHVQNAFGHYLAPAIVDQLSESGAALHLGGELREITVMFADLSGFTSLSGKIDAIELMTLTNAYLGLVVEAVERRGGYVDKFIGDAVMGIWGAPGRNPDHAAAAAQAALDAVNAVMRAKRLADARGEHGYAIKVGLNSGPAVVGNVGAARRYNYTAVGETVNIAARLEGVPGDYGCRIVVGPATAAAIHDRFLLCELDWLKVKGKAEAIAIYELVATKAEATPAAVAAVQAYQAALALYRAGDFASAEKCWQRQAGDADVATSPASVMAERCRELCATPQPVWDGVFVKTTK